MGLIYRDLVEGVGKMVNTLRQVAAGIELLEETTRRLVTIHANAEERALRAQAREDVSREAETVASAEERAREARAREDALREQLESEQKRLLDEIRARDEERAREAQAREDASREAEAAARSREEAALAKAAEASAALLNGIRPVVKLFTPQVQTAMERMQYDSAKLHFGVCGASGSGKSSLLNAFRGLSGRSDLAAAVGVTETTSEVTRYPDSRNEAPYAGFVWYDIPGAGTTAVPDWQYFNDQGLFVLDFIVMVYDVRFTEISIMIMENCLRFNIPVFIVRSKADQHIDNMMKEEEVDFTVVDEDDFTGVNVLDKVYQDLKKTYIEATRSDFRKQMKAMAERPGVDASDREIILSERFNLVSCANVRKVVLSRVKGGADERKMIDEVVLVEDMMSAAARIRSSMPKEKEMFKKGREAM